MTPLMTLNDAVRACTAFADWADLKYHMYDGYVPTLRDPEMEGVMQVRAAVKRAGFRVYPEVLEGE